MLVHPTYKDYWDIPGGFVEPGETPYEACVRELEEELAIRPAIGRLLVADWAPTKRDGDKILFIFDGGHLSDAQHAAITFQDAELSRYQYVDAADIPQFTVSRLVQRLTAALNARDSAKTAYLEHGQRRDPDRQSF